MRKISGRKNTLHLHQNPKDDQGEKKFVIVVIVSSAQSK